MDQIDKTYITQIRTTLDRFKWVQNKANFRCPFCGDSKKNNHKTRAWFLDHPHTRGVTIFKCFNCGMVTSLSSFLKDTSPDIYKQYCYEKYIKPNKQEIVIAENKPKSSDYITYNDFINSPFISTNKSNEYLINIRKFSNSQASNFFYTSDFGNFLKTLPNANKYENQFNNHYQKIVIPFYDDFRNIQLLQFRSINKYDKMRYITIRLNDTFPKIWGLNRINKNKPIYVAEGPFDASFLDNCIAMAGADGTTSFNNLVYIFDNEKRNIEIVNRMVKVVKQGHSIFIWPDVEEKDINDYYIKYNNIKIFKDQARIFNGFKGEMEIDKWRRC